MSEGTENARGRRPVGCLIKSGQTETTPSFHWAPLPTPPAFRLWGGCNALLWRFNDGHPFAGQTPASPVERRSRHNAAHSARYPGAGGGRIGRPCSEACASGSVVSSIDGGEIPPRSTIFRLAKSVSGAVLRVGRKGHDHSTPGTNPQPEKNLPVPVLAEPWSVKGLGEARGSTQEFRTLSRTLAAGSSFRAGHRGLGVTKTRREVTAGHGVSALSSVREVNARDIAHQSDLDTARPLVLVTGSAELLQQLPRHGARAVSIRGDASHCSGGRGGFDSRTAHNRPACDSLSI